MKLTFMRAVASALVVAGMGLDARTAGFDDRAGHASTSWAANVAAPTGAEWTSHRPALPTPTANNAVAAVQTGGHCWIMSALGIGSGLRHSDITTSVYLHRIGDSAWTDVGPPPSAAARVAASAVGVAGKLYLLGGYSVAENGAEASFADLDIYDPLTEAWSAGAPLPVPVDDTVAIAWRDRYIVLVSGWSYTDNVDAVQIYDSTRDTWGTATPFPGVPVFGHAGAIAGDELVVIDGTERGPDGYRLVNQAWSGKLDPARPETIVWADLGRHPGLARYRAAGGSTQAGELWFHGGTDVPYNTNGLAYAGGKPAPPNGSTLVYDGTFSHHPASKGPATMDHRSLARCGGTLYLVGGMTAGPTVTSGVWAITAP